ncbi:MAG: NfeD family protein [Prevotella sp.]
MENVGNEMWQLWAVIAVLGMIIELFTVSFFVICFSVGALFALLTSFFFGIYTQIIVFVIFSMMSIFMVRPFMMKCVHKGNDNRKSNADAIIGQTGTVSQKIKAQGYGRVLLGGDDWKAKSQNGEEIEVGESVVVTGRNSIIIEVTKR